LFNGSASDPVRAAITSDGGGTSGNDAGLIICGHDRARELVVQPAVEGVVVPVVGRLALRLRQCLLGFERIIDDDEIGAARVSTPPTEVGSPLPCALLSNSGIAARCGDRRVGKIVKSWASVSHLPCTGSDRH
jgi:hypothetical protein